MHRTILRVTIQEPVPERTEPWLQVCTLSSFCPVHQTPSPAPPPPKYIHVHCQNMKANKTHSRPRKSDRGAVTGPQINPGPSGETHILPPSRQSHYWPAPICSALKHKLFDTLFVFIKDYQKKLFFERNMAYKSKQNFLGITIRMYCTLGGFHGHGGYLFFLFSLNNLWCTVSTLGKNMLAPIFSCRARA